MADTKLTQALEDVYASINGDNQNIDTLIAALKAAMGDEKSVTMDPAKMVYNNRESRKRLQAYFKKRGVAVEFAEKPKTAA